MSGDEQGWPLVGRDEALRLVRRIATGHERAGVIVTGPRGVGRSRFARAALVGVAAEGNRDAPTAWHPVWTVASGATADLPLGALSHLLPDLDPGDALPVRLLHAARQALLRAKGEARLLLGVDDVHLLDETSAVLLHQLAASGDAFLVLSAPAGAHLPEPVFALWKESLVERIDLAELTREQCDDLVATALGGHVGAATLHRLWSLSQGNPLFLRELVRGAVTSGALTATGRVWHTDGAIPLSARLVEIMQQRTDGSPPLEERLMRLLAFAGPLGVDLAADLTSAATVESAEEHGLVVSRRTGRRVEVALAHPLHAEVLRHTATPYQERACYAQLADALEARGVRREEDHWRLLAWRAGQGSATDPVELLNAAADALDADVHLAERLLREAAAGDDPAGGLAHARILVRLGRAGDADAALAALARRRDLSPRHRAEIGLVRAYNRYWGLRDAPGALTAVAEAEEAGEDGAALRAFGLLLRHDHDAAAVAAAPLLDGTCDDERLVVLAVAATAAAGAGATDEVRGLVARAAEEKGVDPTGGWAVVQLACARWYADLLDGRLDDADATATAEHARAVQDGQRITTALAATWIGIGAARRGRLGTATRWLLEAAASVPSQTFLLTVPLVSELAITTSARGNPARARTVFGEAGDLAVDGPVPGWAGAAEVWLAGAEGRTSEAERIALEVGRSDAALGPRLEALHTAVRLGITGEVTELLDRIATEAPVGTADLYAHHGRALERDDGVQLDAVAERFAAAGMLLLAAESAAQAAAAHRERGATGSAGGSASRARAWADACEGPSTPALERLEGTSDLTRREMEIASLAASGLTSKAIAGRLVVSVRTVDNTLRAVYSKLGVSGRGDLAQVSGIRTSR